MAGTQVVHVVDDDPGMRDSLAFLLETAGLAAMTYASPTLLLESAAKLVPGCILSDIRMPEMDGLALQRRLAELGVRLPVIFMTGHADVPQAVAALKAGAVDFIEKPFEEEAMLGAVRRALASAERDALRQAEREHTGRRMASLTPREREVMEGMILGQATKVIANELGTSPRTIEVHRARVMEKMDVRSLPELVRIVLATREQ